MAISAGAMAFKLAYNIAPIIMTGGIASAIPGGAISVLSISNAIQLIGGLLSPGETPVGVDDYFAFFQAAPGGTLIDQQIGMYPFANQAVAANATIQQPLTISMLMICPAGPGGGYISKAAAMASLQASFDQHNKSGGLYTVLTPSFPYTDLVMTTMTDISSSQTKQVQNTYKIDFLKPLVTLQAAAQAYNVSMAKIAAGLPSSGSLSGPSLVAGSNVGNSAPGFYSNLGGNAALSTSTGSATPPAGPVQGPQS